MPDNDRPAVYLETTFVSYLTSRPSRDLVTAAHQQLTHEWWDTRRDLFTVFVSPLVIDEAGRGDTEAVARRMQVLNGLPLLAVTEGAADLAEDFVTQGPLTERAAVDALHVAIAAVNNMNYLLTWNCKHIANAETHFRMQTICSASGWQLPILCTPEQLMGDTDVER